MSVPIYRWCIAHWHIQWIVRLVLISLFVIALFIQQLMQLNVATAYTTDSAVNAVSITGALPRLINRATVDFTEDLKAMGYPDGRKIVRDSRGHLYVAYRKKYKLQRTTAYHIFVAKSTDGGQRWSVTNRGRPIESTGDGNQRVPAMAIDRHDVLHVVWYGKDDTRGGAADRSRFAGDDNQIKYTRSDTYGESWTPWRNIAYVAGYQGEELWQEHPTIFIDESSGDGLASDDMAARANPTRFPPIYIAWEGRDANHRGAGQIKLVRSLDGGVTWSRWRNVMAASTNQSRPTIVGTTTGELYILAYGRYGRTQQILYTHSRDGGKEWQAWAAVAPSSVDQRHVSAVVDDVGALHVVWRQRVPTLVPWQALGYAPGPPQIYHATLEHQRWISARPVHANPAKAQTFPSISMDNVGTLWLTWSEMTSQETFPNDAPQRGNIYVTTATPSSWNRPMLLGAGQELGHNIYASLIRPIGRAPNHALGTMEVVWLQNRPATKSIQFAQLTVEPPPIDIAILPQRSLAQINTVYPGLSQISQEPLHMFASTMFATPLLLTAISELLVMYSVDLAHFVQAMWDLTPTRELQVLLMILIILALYVISKVVISKVVVAKLPTARMDSTAR